MCLLKQNYIMVGVSLSIDGKELHETEAVCLKFINRKWIDYIMISNNTHGIKNFSRFESDGDIAYVRVDTSGNVINKFVINGDVLKFN